MTFFYDLNKKLAGISDKPETKQLNERDEGKPGKNFAKISADAAKRYGSKAAGDRVAGAVRAKLAKQGKLEENAAAGYDPETQARIKAATPQQLAQMAQEFAGGPAQYQSELKMLQQAKAELSGQMEEGFVDTVKSGAQAALSAIGNTLGHGSDEDMIKDLQKKAGVPVTGKVQPQQPGQQPTGQQPVAEKTDPVAFAALAEPKDKITFADKIAGAKKEVDEMLGDVAAEAMKNALVGGQKKLDKNNNGKLDANDFAMLRAGAKGREETDEGWDDMLKDVERRRSATKKGEITHGAKHDIEDTGTGRRVTRRVDPNTGYSVGSDDDKPADGEKRSRGRPKKDKAPERVTAKAYKHKGGRKVKEGGFDPEQFGSDGSGAGRQGGAGAGDITKEDNSYGQAQQIYNDLADIRAVAKQAQGGGQFPQGFASRLEATLWAAMTLIKNSTGNGAQVRERKLSSSEKEEREDIVKGMKKNKGDFEKRYGKRGEEVMYATATKMAKERGPGNPDRKKKEKTEESGTVAGSVAPAEGGKAKKGSIVGKGIYDSLNRDLEAMIAESMNVSVNMTMDEHGEPHKNITVSAEGEAAEQLAQLLNLAGMSTQQEDHEDCGCGTTPCSCNEEMVDENAPDWPTEPETTGEDDPQMRRWAGGLNGPKSTGQTVNAPFNRQDQRQGVMGEGKDLGMQLYAELKSFKG